MIEPSPTATLSTALREEIRLAGHTLREVSRRLGRRPDYLSQVLRGSPKLKVEQVYTVLVLLGMDPGRFFFALHPPRVANAAERERLMQLFVRREVDQRLRELFVSFDFPAEEAPVGQPVEERR